MDSERGVEKASKGAANTGIALGAVGTGLALLNGGFGGGSGLLGGGGNRAVQGEIFQTEIITGYASALAAERAERYAEKQVFESYKDLTNKIERENDRRDARFNRVEISILEHEKKLAVNEARIEGVIEGVKEKVIALKEETRLAIALEGERRNAGIHSVYEYVAAHYVPGKLVLPAGSICPEVMPRFNTWTAPAAPSEVVVDGPVTVS
jgi:hypothetical protein